MKAEEFTVEIDRKSNPERDHIIRSAHFQAVCMAGHATGSYSSAQMAIAQECIGALYAIDQDGARMLLRAWCDELHGGPKDLGSENEAIRRFTAAEERIDAGRTS